MATLVQLLNEQLAQKNTGMDNPHQRMYLKEVLQAYVLAYLYNHKEYRLLNFYGGTCLRIIYGINRMSEDIDLDNSAGIALDNLEDDLLAYFKVDFANRVLSTTKQGPADGIMRITLKFPVLFELGLSQHQDENLHLKVKISQHKQTAIIERTPVFQFGKSYVARHFTIESLMAGKILACLERSFHVGNTQTDFKARDFYDLLWLMQKRIIPQQEKLHADGKESYTIPSSMNKLKGRIEKINTRDLKRDLLPLFEDAVFIEAWCDSFHENFDRFSQYYLST